MRPAFCIRRLESYILGRTTVREPHEPFITFDYAKALGGNHASLHGDDVVGKPTLANMAFNYSIIPARPAGGIWTSAHDFIRYAQLGLNLGKLPDGVSVYVTALAISTHDQQRLEMAASRALIDAGVNSLISCSSLA